MAHTVVITRPAAQAGVLAERLAAAGFEPLIFPAIDIAPAADAAPLRAALTRLDQYRLVIFVSPNAIQHAVLHRTEAWPAALPVGVMGPGSVAALADCGIAAPLHTIYAPQPAAQGTVNPVRFDSESLLQQLDIPALRGARVLIVKGNGGRPWLAQRLGELGVQVDQVESYQRSRHRADPQQQAVLLQWIEHPSEPTAHANRPTWIVTSSEAVAYLFEALTEIAGARGAAWLQSCRWLVPHPRIAENATAAGVRDVVLSGAGDAGIVQALK